MRIVMLQKHKFAQGELDRMMISLQALSKKFWQVRNEQYVKHYNTILNNSVLHYSHNFLYFVFKH